MLRLDIERKRGRKVAMLPAKMPRPGSIFDQMLMSVVAPAELWVISAERQALGIELGDAVEEVARRKTYKESRMSGQTDRYMEDERW